MVTTFSGAIIRTTHLTGLVTDLGAKIGHWLRGGMMDNRQLLLHILFITGFISGGAAGAWLFIRLGYKTWLIPALITGVSGLGYMMYALWLRKENRSIEILL